MTLILESNNPIAFFFSHYNIIIIYSHFKKIMNELHKLEKKLEPLKSQLPPMEYNRIRNIWIQKELKYNFKLIQQIMRISMPFRLG